MSWEPAVYAEFLGPRTRPAVDLVNAIALASVDHAVDLGCGPGNSTRVIQARWPHARLVGLDSSEAMLETARTQGPAGVDWRLGDVRTWTPEAPPDLLFSNATLQWVDDHAALLPRLLDAVCPGGVLAIQMPRNFDAPSHLAIREVALGPRWAARLGPHLRVAPVAPPERVFDLLAAAHTLDVWETEYVHALSGPDPVLQWISGTALVPLREALGPSDYPAFREAVGAALREAYPERPDGTTLFPFRRQFIVATRRG